MKTHLTTGKHVRSSLISAFKLVTGCWLGQPCVAHWARLAQGTAWLRFLPLQPGPKQPRGQCHLSLGIMDFVCLAAFSQLCCGLKDKSSGSRLFSFFPVPHMKEKHWVAPAGCTACATPAGTMWSAVRDTAIPQLQSLEEINLSVLQNSIKTVSIDKA